MQDLQYTHNQKVWHPTILYQEKYLQAYTKDRIIWMPIQAIDRNHSPQDRKSIEAHASSNTGGGAQALSLTGGRTGSLAECPGWTC